MTVWRLSSPVSKIQRRPRIMFSVRSKRLSTEAGSEFGIGRGQSKLTGLPVPPTDSIFAVIVEELGLLGAIFLIVLYGILIWRGFVIARRAPDMLGTLIASGLVVSIGIQAAINMSVMVGLISFSGDALPFVSAGGSN